MLFRSLSIRFIVSAVVAVAAGFSLFIGVVYTRLDASLRSQAAALEAITTNNLSELLLADHGLAAARLRFMSEDIARRIEAIANRADTTMVVFSRNNVAIAELLKPAASNAEVDSIVVTDRQGNVVGASSSVFDLVAIDRRLKASSYYGRILSVLEEADVDRSARIVDLMTAEEMPPVLDDARRTIQLVVVQPLYDEFGDVAGSLIAQRSLRALEPTLEEFTEITKVAVAVYYGDELVSQAGTRFVPNVDERPTSFVDPENQHVSRCGPALKRLELCALKPLEELYRAQREVTEIGRAEGISLVRWLGIVGLGASMFLTLILWLTARPITQPMKGLAEAVGFIARGVYDVPIEGQGRQDEVGSIARAVAVLNDSAKERDGLRADIFDKNVILERRESELRNQNRLFDAALNNMSHGLCMFDRDRNLIVSNRRYEEIFGFVRGDVAPGISFETLKAMENVVAETSETDDGTGAAPAGLSDIERTTSNVRLQDGRTILCTRQPLVGGGWVAIYEDITERQRARERLVHLAKHDALTGLPNRVTLREHLSRQLDRQRAEGGTFGVLCLDLDEFKTINDTFGHPAGDRLLCHVARRLRTCVDDIELVARLGGDEFAIVTRIAPSTETLSIRCETLVKVIAEPVVMEDHEAVISVSIGVAVAPSDGRDPDTLLKQADLALYRAKFEGRNTFRFFEPNMEVAVKARHDMVTDLRVAIENEELECFFQPQVDFVSGEISGFEALMRWRNPRLGMVPPVEFIPLAEETGLILPMGEWILRTATLEATRWPDPVRVAVNLSARQLQRTGFVEMVVDALDTSGLAPHRLELEVTESVLLQDDDITRESLSALKGLGVKISLDDFGTGFSSLSCLRSFPFDKIKIDQSFVRAIPTSNEAGSIVAAVISLAQNLGIATTAEGIETEDLYELLRLSGCTEGQGYWIGRPETAAQAAARVGAAAGRLSA